MAELIFRARRDAADPDRQLSYGTRQWDGTAEELADKVAEFLRTSHPEARTGGLTVWVWPNCGDVEHYRQPTPPEAAAFRYPAPAAAQGA